MKSILTGIMLLFTFSVVSGQQIQNIPAVAKDINVQEFSRLMKEKPGLLLDVRTQGEINKGAIEGFVHLDFFADNFDTELDKLDKSKPVYVYCASGGRSHEAMEMMQKKGFSEVYNLDGGYIAWKKTYPDK